MNATLSRRLVAEGLGTALLLSVVVGSGIMAEQLSGGSTALALLANTLATGAGLLALILTLGPISGAHFNPCVTLAAMWQKQLAPHEAAAYVLVQLPAAILGVWLAHAMFALPVLELSRHVRHGQGQWLSEGVATFSLLLVILGTSRHGPAKTLMAVAAIITAAYWFTASTSFANPAVTVARALTDSFAGIRPSDVPGFLLAQLAGAITAIACTGWLLQNGSSDQLPDTP